jgi:hypothetical protein
MPGPADPLPDLLLERLALGDLDPARATARRSRLLGPDGRARLAEIEASNRAILAAYPPATVAAEVKRRLDLLERAPSIGRRNVTGRLWLRATLGALAAATVAIVGVGPAPGPGGPVRRGVVPPAEETITLKGLRPHLVIYRKTPAGATRLSEESPVQAGDTLQVAYVAGRRRFGVVAAQDARGAVTLLHPIGGTEAALLSEGAEIPTTHAFELDDSPGFERFVFVTSDQPFSTAGVLAALRVKDDRRLPRGTTLTAIVLRKEPR